MDSIHPIRFLYAIRSVIEQAAHGNRIYVMKPDISYFFHRIGHIRSELLNEIIGLIETGGGVGTSLVQENLDHAFLIGYAMCDSEVVGTSTHKYPQTQYRRKIEAVTGLDLSGFLERGYTAVRPDFRGLGLGGALIRGLIERSRDQRIYVTIRLDNTPALKMTYKENMLLAATFVNARTGHELGVFTNIDPEQIDRL